MTSGVFIHVPRVIGSVSSKMGRIGIESSDDLTKQGAKRGNIVFVERLGLFGQDDISRVGSGSSGDARAIPPEEFFLLLLLFLVRGL